MLSAILVTLVIGGALGLVLGVASKVFEVQVDTRIEDVTGLLPGYNCGGCGYAGCSGMAEALVTGEVPATTPCKPCKAEQREAIIKYLSETPGPNGETVTLKG